VHVNNRYLGMVRQWQEIEYSGRYSHSYMDALPNFVWRRLRGTTR
jgi:acetolactate synthase-1/2/3 large subunit